jgi:hypothetical protein
MGFARGHHILCRYATTFQLKYAVLVLWQLYQE